MSEERYWRSAVSVVEERRVRVRGYDLESLIGRLTFADAAYLLIRGELPDATQRRVLDAVLTSVLDYALQKPGTVAARFITSANPSMAAALAGAALAVGPHTLDPADTVAFAQSSVRAFAESGKPLDEFAASVVADLRARRARVPGLGHPVFQRVDPRAARLRQIAVDAGVWNEVGDVYEAIHRAFTALPGKEAIPINDVGMIGVVLAQLGFTAAESTGLAIVSTLPGVIAHVSEELDARKPIRVISPEHVDYEIEARELPEGWEYGK